MPDRSLAGVCSLVDLGHNSWGKSLNTSFIAVKGPDLLLWFRSWVLCRVLCNIIRLWYGHYIGRLCRLQHRWYFCNLRSLSTSFISTVIIYGMIRRRSGRRHRSSSSPLMRLFRPLRLPTTFTGVWRGWSRRGRRWWSMLSPLSWFVFSFSLISAASSSYLDCYLYIDNGKFTTRFYDKRDDFNFPIVNFPFLSSNIPSAPAYGVYVSQLSIMPEPVQIIRTSWNVGKSSVQSCWARGIKKPNW